MHSLAVVCHTVPPSVQVSWRGIPPPRTAPPELERVHTSATHWESMGVGEKERRGRRKYKEEWERKRAEEKGGFKFKQECTRMGGLSKSM